MSHVDVQRHFCVTVGVALPQRFAELVSGTSRPTQMRGLGQEYPRLRVFQVSTLAAQSGHFRLSVNLSSAIGLEDFKRQTPRVVQVVHQAVRRIGACFSTSGTRVRPSGLLSPIGVFLHVGDTSSSIWPPVTHRCVSPRQGHEFVHLASCHPLACFSTSGTRVRPSGLLSPIGQRKTRHKTTRPEIDELVNPM